MEERKPKPNRLSERVNLLLGKKWHLSIEERQRLLHQEISKHLIEKMRIPREKKLRTLELDEQASGIRAFQRAISNGTATVGIQRKLYRTAMDELMSIRNVRNKRIPQKMRKEASKIILQALRELRGMDKKREAIYQPPIIQFLWEINALAMEELLGKKEDIFSKARSRALLLTAERDEKTTQQIKN